MHPNKQYYHLTTALDQHSHLEKKDIKSEFLNRHSRQMGSRLDFTLFEGKLKQQVMHNIYIIYLSLKAQLTL